MPDLDGDAAPDKPEPFLLYWSRADEIVRRGPFDLALCNNCRVYYVEGERHRCRDAHAECSE